jgi:hypothetical protein
MFPYLSPSGCGKDGVTLWITKKHY